MFTLIEVVGPGYNIFSLALSVLADVIFIGAMYIGHRRENKKLNH